MRRRRAKVRHGAGTEVRRQVALRPILRGRDRQFIAAGMGWAERSKVPRALARGTAVEGVEHSAPDVHKPTLGPVDKVASVAFSRSTKWRRNPPMRACVRKVRGEAYQGCAGKQDDLLIRTGLAGPGRPPRLLRVRAFQTRPAPQYGTAAKGQTWCRRANRIILGSRIGRDYRTHWVRV
jgi:hypothetical protein